MPGFIASARGSVKSVQGPWLQPANFRVNMGNDINIYPSNIITQVGVVQQGNFQFLHTINADIFVYIFGDRMTELVVGGLSFAENCDFGTNGADDLFLAYANNRIAVAADTHIITVGTTTFTGFLTRSNFDVNDPETILGSWAFNFHVTAQST
jgi:hypothetical protein